MKLKMTYAGDEISWALTKTKAEILKIWWHIKQFETR